MNPIATDEFSRLQVELFDERGIGPAPIAFQSAFYGRPETGAKTVFQENQETIEIDIIRSTGNTLAQLVNRGTSSGDVTRIEHQTETKFTNIVRKWPLVETEGFISSVELLKRSPGVNPFVEQTRQDRLMAKAIDINSEMLMQHVTTVEFLAREALFTGQHPAILNTTNAALIYDFFRNSANTIAVGTVWTDVAADIIGDIDSGIDEIQQNSFLHGDYGLIMDGVAFGGFKKNTVISGDADNRRFFFVSLGGDAVELPTEFQKYKDGGFNPRGFLETDLGRRVWIFTYDLTFQDTFTTPGTSTTTPWIPSGQALLFHPKARCDRYFGPPDRMPVTATEAIWYQDTFGFDMTAPPMMPQMNEGFKAVDTRMLHFDAYAGPDKKGVVLRTQSAPIMPTTQTDAFVVFNSLI